MGLPSDYECSYCLDQLSTMVDPRKLPCGHVFCLECLRADTSSGGNRTTCARCSKKYKALDLDNLPVYELDNAHPEIEIEQAEEEEIPEPIPCPRPKCNNESVCYCDSCKTTLCEKHKEVEEIKARAEDRKRQIRDFPLAMDSAVTEYVDGLHEKEHHLKDVENELSRMMRESHITEIIRENKTNQKKISDALVLTPGDCDALREMVVAPTGCIRDVEVELRPLYPGGIVKLCHSSSQSYSQCINITDRGDVLTYTGGNVMINTVNFKHTKASVQVQNVVSLAQIGDRVYVGIYQGSQFTCMVYNYELSKSSKLLQFPTENPGTKYPQMDVDAEGLFIISKSSYSQGVLVYDHKGLKLRQVNLPVKPSGIWNFPGSHILVLEQGGLVKYEVSSTEARRQQSVSIGGYWTCDSAGVIYRATNPYRQANSLEIYSIATGEQIRKLKVDETHLYEFSVRNNMLVARDDKGRSHLYHLTY